MPAELRSISHGQTMVLTLHNPEHRNRLEPGMVAAAVEALNAAGDNADIRSVVIVGEGDAFCDGVGAHRLRDSRAQPAASQADLIDALNLLVETVSTFPMPVVAAVEGPATGAGFALALACDMVVAARDAVFALPQGRLGVAPDGGASWHLAQALPRPLANEIALLGEPVPAERLYALGLVNRLVAPGQALSAALALADTLNQRAPNVLEGTKELLAAAPHVTLGRHLAAERTQVLVTLNHANAGIGLAAFMQKRVPDFE